MSAKTITVELADANAGLMPAIFGGQLTAAQLEIIVQFLASQQ